tara:strand:- start:1321 stop:1842 length:522 start_codon:yes stop_codon:yes gene_type:complete
MPKFKAYVKVPADSKGSLKRIVTKTISADNSVNALAQLRGQYGSSNVNIASQVMPGMKPRSRPLTRSNRSYTPKVSTSFSRRNRTYKYAKPVTKGQYDASAGMGAIFLGFVIFSYFLLKIFNLVTLQLMYAFFGKNKVYYWAVNNKHALAFSLSSINMMMLYLLYEAILIYFY